MNNILSKSLLRKNFKSIESPKKPDWIKVKIPSKSTQTLKNNFKLNHVTTVCEEAMCPNLDECWSKKHATFMILGDVCTRSCSFCNIHTGKPGPVDPFEPVRVAKSVVELKLQHVVITSVDRDDLIDGGASQFISTINQIKKMRPQTSIEILTPDFKNKKNVLEKIANTEIDVFNHNLETVKRLYNQVRPGAIYEHSLGLLKKIKHLNQKIFTKSGIMIGLGESYEEIIELMSDLRECDVDFLTIGQYLRPSKHHHPVVKYHSEDYFLKLYLAAKKTGFEIVASSPFTRSSYHAQDDFNKLKAIQIDAQTK